MEKWRRCFRVNSDKHSVRHDNDQHASWDRIALKAIDEDPIRSIVLLTMQRVFSLADAAH